MNILHTADWHIGKVLHKHHLRDEMQMFFDWLIAIIKERDIDLLLVSGDVFDHSNPSVQDRKDYYSFLNRLIGTKTQVIITGGNHDSVHVINAPAEILSQLQITVVGGACDSLEEELIEVKNEQGEIKLIVAAVPFLRDRDLRNLNSEEKYTNKTEALQAGIKAHYTRLGEICSTKYPKLPTIAMGHLYAIGSITSDSEREIHLGNTAAVEANIFPKVFNYVALGHIHRPQIIGGNKMIRYSGSPIALSFSEKEDQKCLLQVNLNGNNFSEPEKIMVPKWRELRKISGSFTEVEQKINVYNPAFDLPSFVEIEVYEKAFSNEVIINLEELVANSHSQEKYKILKHRPKFETGIKDTAQLFEEGKHIEDLTPKEVFLARIDQEEFEPEKRQELIEAFQEILEQVEQG